MNIQENPSNASENVFWKIGKNHENKTFLIPLIKHKYILPKQHENTLLRHFYKYDIIKLNNLNNLPDEYEAMKCQEIPCCAKHAGCKISK